MWRPRKIEYMAVLSTTWVSPSSGGDLEDPAGPVVADLASVPGAHRIAPHRHRRGQFVFATRGSLAVWAAGRGLWVSPQCGVWIPPRTVHAVSALSAIDYCSLFVDTHASRSLPRQVRLYTLTSLLTELAGAAAEFSHNREAAELAPHLHALLLDRLQRLEPACVSLPVPCSARLRSLTDYLLCHPGESFSLEDWAARLGMSRATLARRFRHQTGLSVGRWRQQMKVLKAIELLHAGSSVKAVAFELGYRQPSPFITMFKRLTGRTPGSYLRHTS